MNGTWSLIVAQVQNLEPRICYAKVCVICKLQTYEVHNKVEQNPTGLDRVLPVPTRLPKNPKHVAFMDAKILTIMVGKKNHFHNKIDKIE